MARKNPIEILIETAKISNIDEKVIKAAEDEFARIRIVHYTTLAEAVHLMTESKKLSEQLEQFTKK